MHALLSEYPFLREQLPARDATFAPLAAPERRAMAWARMTTLGDLAVSTDVPWPRLVRELRGRITAELGAAPPVAGGGHARTGDRRVAELRAIAGELEDGGSLLELAARLQSLTDGLTAADAAALDEALVRDAGRARDHAADSVAREAQAPEPETAPPGHPLDSQRRAADQLRLLGAGLGDALSRLGGSPSRRRWQAAKVVVERLIERISDVEAMFLRHRQAWFPALAVHGVEGLATLLGDREAEALELLRRLRLAVDRDDGAFVADAGARLLELLDDILGTIDRVVVPLAERHLSEADWTAVRELEDAVGFVLIPPPPPWPADDPV